MTPQAKANFTGSWAFFLFMVVLIRSLIISPFRIPSGSMIPTLKVGDFILTSKFSYGWSRYSFLFGGYFNYFSGKLREGSFPKRGDVIVFANPTNTSMDYIKRVVGIPGDTVQMIQGRLNLNGKEIPLKEIQKNYQDWDGVKKIHGTVYEAMIPKDNTQGGPTVTYKILKQEAFGFGQLDHTPAHKIPDNNVFCMGDNWDGSGDSRVIESLGFIPKEYFLGPAWLVFFSVDHEDVKLWKPWTWLLLPFKVRLSRFVFHLIR